MFVTSFECFCDTKKNILQRSAMGRTKNQTVYVIKAIHIYLNITA
jgi:hypothetical protein